MRGCFKIAILKKMLLFRAQNTEHLGAAGRANARHRAARHATLALHGNFFGVLHLFFGLALDTISFGHSFYVY